MNNPVPDGYMKDGQGRLVPADLVKPVDLLRNDTVQEIIDAALKTRQVIKEFKQRSMGDIQAFIELSAEKYGVKLGGKKGNVSLLSYNGQYKIQIANAEYISFDERLQIAKELIDECIHRWSENSGSEIRALVEHAFRVDKQGQVSTQNILGLLKLDIKDQQWRKAMSAISESMQVVGTKTYIRVYERAGDDDHWEAISLDIAAL